MEGGQALASLLSGCLSFFLVEPSLLSLFFLPCSLGGGRRSWLSTLSLPVSGTSLSLSLSFSLLFPLTFLSHPNPSIPPPPPFPHSLQVLCMSLHDLRRMGAGGSPQDIPDLQAQEMAESRYRWMGSVVHVRYVLPFFPPSLLPSLPPLLLLGSNNINV